jgi:hypothetical protein
MQEMEEFGRHWPISGKALLHVVVEHPDQLGVGTAPEIGDPGQRDGMRYAGEYGFAPGLCG